jgi:hypothetical protein
MLPEPPPGPCPVRSLHSSLPNRGHCELVYLCAGLYVTNGRSDEALSAVPVFVRYGSPSIRASE